MLQKSLSDEEGQWGFGFCVTDLMLDLNNYTGGVFLKVLVVFALISTSNRMSIAMFRIEQCTRNKGFHRLRQQLTSGADIVPKS